MYILLSQKAAKEGSQFWGNFITALVRVWPTTTHITVTSQTHVLPRAEINLYTKPAPSRPRSLCFTSSAAPWWKIRPSMRRKALPVAPVPAEVGSGCNRGSLACRERESAGLSKPPKPQSQQKGLCLWDKPSGECPRDPESKGGMEKHHSKLLYTAPIKTVGKIWLYVPFRLVEQGSNGTWELGYPLRLLIMIKPARLGWRLWSLNDTV